LLLDVMSIVLSLTRSIVIYYPGFVKVSSALVLFNS
jgi:hypothetical protein